LGGKDDSIDQLSQSPSGGVKWGHPEYKQNIAHSKVIFGLDLKFCHYKGTVELVHVMMAHGGEEV
jgi:hypothetical protein